MTAIRNGTDQKIIAAYLRLEVEGPDHAQGEDDTDDRKQGDDTDVETAAYLGLEIEGPEHDQDEDDTDDSRQGDATNKKVQQMPTFGLRQEVLTIRRYNIYLPLA